MKISVGSTVKIRTWESLVSQYGTDKRGDINIGNEEEGVFVIWSDGPMQDTCGTEGVVEYHEGFDDPYVNGFYWSLEALTLIDTAQSGEGKVELSETVLEIMQRVFGKTRFMLNGATTNSEISICMHDFAQQHSAALQKELEQTKKDCNYYINLSSTYLKSTSDALDELARLRAENSALIDRIKALEAGAEWISVDERLPEANRHVLMVVKIPTESVVTKAFYSTLAKQFIGSFDGWPITHWMPLPEPPKTT